jgi:hypothetical protein
VREMAPLRSRSDTRVGGIEAATLLARQRSGSQFDPALAGLLCSQAEGILGDLDGINTWRAVIEGEPSLTRVLGADEFDAALAAVANFVDLKSPCKLGHSVAVSPSWQRGRAGCWGSLRGRCAPSDVRPWCTASGVSASRTRSGTSRGRSVPANGSGSAFIPT